MGWTSINADTSSAKSIKAFLDNTFGGSTDTADFNILKSSMVGSVHYCAIERIIKATGDRIVFAMVTKTSIDNSSYYNLFYKDMDESMIPYYYDCPKSILNLLTPTDNENSNKWRKLCYEKLEKKKTSVSSLPVNSVIKLTMSADTTHFKKGDKITVQKVTGYGYKKPFWKIVGFAVKVPTAYINNSEYEIIS